MIVVLIIFAIRMECIDISYVWAKTVVVLVASLNSQVLFNTNTPEQWQQAQQQF